jgi:class 3 adenylate cyclase/HAMP domain-containing protein
MAPVAERRGRLFRKYAVLLVALVGGTLLASGLIDLYFSYQEVRVGLVRLQREKARLAATRIEQFIRDVEHQTRWATGSPEATLDERRFDYLRLLRQVPAITEVALLDSSGREQLRVSRVGRGAVKSQADFSRQPHFLEAKSGTTHFSPVYFRSDSEPYMTMALAGDDADAGVTVVDVNLKFAWDVVSQIRIGKAAQAYAVDSRGQLVAHQDISLVLQKADLSALPQVQAARAAPRTPDDEEHQVTTARDRRGRPVLAAYATVTPSGWFVFVEQPLAEAFAPLYASIVRSTVLLLVGLAVSVLVSLLFARKMVAPIQAVQAGAAKIGAGGLDHRIEVRTGDELQDLADQVNLMASQLQESYASLEARNAELATALENLTESMKKVELLEQIKGELAKFVPESVNRLLEQHPDARELEKREADVSVLFLDVEGYTRLSEQLPPQRLNRMIQDYFSAFLEIIRTNHGDVNETVGDGLMVIFQSEGGPARHALNAAGAAFQLQARVAELNQEFAGIYPPVAIHVGINSGPAFVGATKLDAAGGGRWTFTASGPTTNLAARVAALTRGAEVKVGPETAERIRGHYVLQDTGEHQLKNVSQPVRVYHLVPAGVYRTVDQ